ncbi:hypothetical protein [Desulfopila inferna]|uniref:hypothetical protein n=1 Tax=Desulfopila inferna TaxID=468528 RepID=UPI001962DA2B|nr:hypothetical protein [Desulfopila inferna]MBM9604458.1 hypothetical protein [Desulfopila inferna]
MEYKIEPILEGVGGVISGMKAELSLDNVTAKLRGKQNRAALVEAASKILCTARGIWCPRIVYRWVDVVLQDNDTLQLCCNQSMHKIKLSLGFSGKFLHQASRALIGVYTVGQALEEASAQASRKRRVLDAYLYDIVSLTLLDQLKYSVNEIVELYAQKRGWGVSPFLSPGSVHGWELEDQANLCSMLPLDMIDVRLQENNTLMPFKSISFLIGTGPGYQVKKVRATCEVCSKREACEMQTKE